MMLSLLFFVALFSPEISSPFVWKPGACDYFSGANAVRILHEDVSWTGTSSAGIDPKKWTCTFVPKGGPDGPKVHFGLSRFTTEGEAKADFDSIFRSNKDEAEFERWHGVGDEAIVHSDGVNFHLVAVRSGVRSFRIKVSPAGSTALDDVKAVAEDLVKKMEKTERE